MLYGGYKIRNAQTGTARYVPDSARMASSGLSATVPHENATVVHRIFSVPYSNVYIELKQGGSRRNQPSLTSACRWSPPFRILKDSLTVRAALTECTLTGHHLSRTAQTTDMNALSQNVLGGTWFLTE